MWSGGLDSTALVWRYLTRGYQVSAGYIAFRNNTWQTACELRAIDRMLPLLEQHNFKFKGVIGWFKWNYVDNINLRYAHSIVTITFSAMLNETFDEMAIGVVRDDRVTQEEIRKLHAVFRSMRPLMSRKNKLVFPLRRTFKKTLLGSLPIELSKHIWSCTNAERRRGYKPCGQCSRCKQYAKSFAKVGAGNGTGYNSRIRRGS